MFCQITVLYAHQVAALDGVRGWVSIGVLLAHVNMDWFPGVLALMELFFVISGFLITSILLNNVYQHKNMDLLDFWKRRLLRLYPVLIVVVTIFCIGAIILLDHPKASLMDGIQTLLYVSNFSKLESSPFPTLFAQTWSLAIEEQFYLFWPVLFFISLQLNLTTKQLSLLLTALACACILWKIHLIISGASWSRLYYGTDTRMDAFIIGGLLAIHFPLLHNWMKYRLFKHLLALFIVIYAVLLLLGSTRVLEYFIWQQPFTLVGSAALILVLTSSSPSHLKIFFNNTLSVYLGKRSYSIYLWHWPLIWFGLVLFNPDRLLLLCFILPFTLVLAHVSYQFIELPFMAHRKAMPKNDGLTLSSQPVPHSH